ncbi:cyclopropane-fatty-acyl-phospholipid synthase 1 [Mycobacterium sp. AT1]|nr:cyclopropane-fatty-acyl-phospholipid synthase 1 [Mycobacterium sp. AT1]
MTLSKTQTEHVERLFAASDSPRSKRVLLQGWEQFDEPVDRIVSIGAFEHFGHDRYEAFFEMANGVLPDDGIMLLHSITGLHPDEMRERGMPLTFTFARFLKFMWTEIFPGGRLPTIPMVQERATAGGFRVTRVDMFRVGYIDVNQFTCAK